ncbi:ABC transporter permease, partial [Brucella ceti B1/94]
MNARLTGLGLNLLSFAVGIGGWYLLTATGAVVLPGPVDVLERAVTLLLNGQLVGDIFASLRRVLSGFVLGVALAIPV